MKEVVVDVTRREAIGKNVSRRLRRSGAIPAVLYGGGKEPVILQVDPIRIEQILRSESGVNTIFQLNMAGTDQRRHVMIREYQVDPIEGELLHADFLRIAMDAVIEVEVPIRLQGESAGVKLDGGILEPVTRTVRISCLPGDIPEHFDLDVSAMKINDHLSIADLPKSDKFTLLSDPGLIVVVVAPPAKEEAAATPGVEAAAPLASEPEVIKKGKQVAEGEEGKAEEGEKKAKPEAKK
jgi:large subunit ribosomal protein L25